MAHSQNSTSSAVHIETQGKESKNSHKKTSLNLVTLPVARGYFLGICTFDKPGVSIALTRYKCFNSSVIFC